MNHGCSGGSFVVNEIIFKGQCVSVEIQASREKEPRLGAYMHP